MFSFYDMVKASSATTGSGSIVTASAVSPYRAFSGVVADGASVRYLILDAGAWERGYGVYTSSTGGLTRNLECSSTGSLLNLSGAATVEIVMGASDVQSAPIGSVDTPISGQVSVFALANIVPQMTSNTSGGAVASASSIYGGTGGEYAPYTNNRYATAGWITNASQTGWTRIQLPAAQKVYCYSVVGWSVDTWSNRCPKSWTFEGSNDGSTWTTLDTRTNVDQNIWIRWVERFFPISSPNSYLYYRLNVTANYGDAYMGVSQVVLYGEANPPTGGFSALFMKTPAGEIVPLSRQGFL